MKRWITAAAVIWIPILGVSLLLYSNHPKPLTPTINTESPSPMPTPITSIVAADSQDSEPLPVTFLTPSTPLPTLAEAPITPTVTPAAPAKEPEQPTESEEISIPVLNYHSIGDEPGNTLVLHPDKLARQMAYLKENGYTPLTLSDFILILEKELKPPAKPVLLTFDDGYTDNYELALPVLKPYGFPATLFISPGAIGQPDYLNWEQVKDMHKAGWTIQPHGMTHPYLSKLTAEKQKEEIMEARRQIEKQLGTKADVFCYPYGDFNSKTLAILKEVGFRYAFTIEQGRTTSSQKPLQLKRIYVNGEDSLAAWSKKLK
ncbi:polysaccharide deacetylase family protein [Paenibacillus sp. GCM10027628]|uniref:polysaccharide deacetylase family protein n=1 Tax=Paenibacillus sp. GCM10027628 TaxID=3273413 RepID=UPI00362FCC5D